MYANSYHLSETLRIDIISVCSTEGLLILQRERDVKKEPSPASKFSYDDQEKR